MQNSSVGQRQFMGGQGANPLFTSSFPGALGAVNTNAQTSIDLTGSTEIPHPLQGLIDTLEGAGLVVIDPHATAEKLLEKHITRVGNTFMYNPHTECLLNPKKPRGKGKGKAVTKAAPKGKGKAAPKTATQTAPRAVEPVETFSTAVSSGVNVESSVRGWGQTHPMGAQNGLAGSINPAPFTGQGFIGGGYNPQAAGMNAIGGFINNAQGMNTLAVMSGANGTGNIDPAMFSHVGQPQVQYPGLNINNGPSTSAGPSIPTGASSSRKRSFGEQTTGVRPSEEGQMASPLGSNDYDQANKRRRPSRVSALDGYQRPAAVPVPTALSAPMVRQMELQRAGVSQSPTAVSFSSMVSTARSASQRSRPVASTPQPVTQMSPPNAAQSPQFDTLGFLDQYFPAGADEKQKREAIQRMFAMQAQHAQGRLANGMNFNPGQGN